jgi:hypothetical protein
MMNSSAINKEATHMPKQYNGMADKIFAFVLGLLALLIILHTLGALFV